MRILNPVLIGLALALSLPSSPSGAQVVMGFEAHGGRVDLSIGAYPEFVPVPGYPVYYAPDLGRNYFFYDGLYWVFHHDRWYSSDWYDGPWDAVDPFDVPLFVLRVPLRYYADPPPYFGDWDPDRAPRWHEYFGRDWAEAHRGWERFDRDRLPPRAPLPEYQRRFRGDRYPSGAERDDLRSQHYRYAPSDPAVRGYYDRHGGGWPPSTRERRPEEGRNEGYRPEERRREPDEERRGEDRLTPEGILDRLREERSREAPPPPSVPRSEAPRGPETPDARAHGERGTYTGPRPAPPTAAPGARETHPNSAPPPQKPVPPARATPPAEKKVPPSERREKEPTREDAPR